MDRLLWIFIFFLEKTENEDKVLKNVDGRFFFYGNKPWKKQFFLDVLEICVLLWQKRRRNFFELFFRLTFGVRAARIADWSGIGDHGRQRSIAFAIASLDLEEILCVWRESADQGGQFVAHDALNRPVSIVLWVIRREKDHVSGDEAVGLVGRGVIDHDGGRIAQHRHNGQVQRERWRGWNEKTVRKMFRSINWNFWKEGWRKTLMQRNVVRLNRQFFDWMEFFFRIFVWKSCFLIVVRRNSYRLRMSDWSRWDSRCSGCGPWTLWLQTCTACWVAVHRWAFPGRWTRTFLVAAIPHSLANSEPCRRDCPSVTDPGRGRSQWNVE